MWSEENKIVSPEKADTERILLHEEYKDKIEADVLRLDKIHPVVSGNKWFKLKNYLQEAMREKHHTLLTWGGAYSNHIVATAFAANYFGLKSIGIIRGERPAQLSHT